jgi:threonyl-tRNA synthetase
VDFHNPSRFKLEYIGEDGKSHQPVMLHRALLGSMERFFGVLIEHYAGAFPLWLAPVQAAVLPIADRHHGYAARVQDALRRAGLRTEVDARSEKIGAKIRDAQLRKIPFMLIAGDREEQAGTVAVRSRREGEVGAKTIDEVCAMMGRMQAERAPSP